MNLEGFGGVGCRIYWFVRILARLLSTLSAGQISSKRAIWLPDSTVLPLSPRFFLFIIHREACESVITVSLWLSQPCCGTIYMADLLKTTAFDCCRYSGYTFADRLRWCYLQDSKKRFRTQYCQPKVVLRMSCRWKVGENNVLFYQNTIRLESINHFYFHFKMTIVCINFSSLNKMSNKW